MLWQLGQIASSGMMEKQCRHWFSITSLVQSLASSGFFFNPVSMKAGRLYCVGAGGLTGASAMVVMNDETTLSVLLVLPYP